MDVSNTSFGRVLAVSGPSRKIQKVTKKLTSELNSGSVMVKNVTSFYKYAPNGGDMAKAAKRGDTIDLFITGEDIIKIKQKKEGWNSVNEILSHMQDHINIANMTLTEVVDKILGKGVAKK